MTVTPKWKQTLFTSNCFWGVKKNWQRTRYSFVLSNKSDARSVSLTTFIGIIFCFLMHANNLLFITTLITSPLKCFVLHFRNEIFRVGIYFRMKYLGWIVSLYEILQSKIMFPQWNNFCFGVYLWLVFMRIWLALCILYICWLNN